MFSSSHLRLHARFSHSLPLSRPLCMLPCASPIVALMFLFCFSSPFL